MGFRFRKRIKVFPGFHLNLGKNGINSVSARVGMFTRNFNRHGTKDTFGLHGTGLSYETERNRYGISGGRGSLFVWTMVILFLIWIIF